MEFKGTKAKTDVAWPEGRVTIAALSMESIRAKAKVGHQVGLINYSSNALRRCVGVTRVRRNRYK